MIAHIELKTGIKCKKRLALLAPKIDTPLFQAKKDVILAKIAT